MKVFVYKCQHCRKPFHKEDEITVSGARFSVATSDEARWVEVKPHQLKGTCAKCTRIAT